MTAEHQRMSALHQGDRIHNYLLERRLGSGGCGEVWLAKHHVFGDCVAIKVPQDERFARQLRREGIAAHRLKHPNIVRVIDLDPSASPPYLVMEYIEGPSLRQAIAHYGATFPVGAAVTILRGVLGALEAAHGMGIVHRDVKPENILLQCAIDGIPSIPESAVRVSDFGLGLAAGAGRELVQSISLDAAQGREIAGTIAYMSPEQREGQTLDGRSDLYSCGIILFEMLTGERPQGSEVPGTLRSGIPGYLNDVFERCYTRCERRFASAKALRDALRDPAQPPPLRNRTEAGGQSRWVPNRESVTTLEDAGSALSCTACGTSVEYGDNFCIHCGQPLAESLPKCGSCGSMVRSQDRFCIRCGKGLNAWA